MEQEEKKDGNYALSNWKDIWKYDPTRLLDLGNDFQVAISQNKPEIDEESRAISNFEKLTEDRRRPVSHTLVDATRVLPDLIALATGPGIAAAKKAIGKKAAEKTGSKVARKIVGENTSDIAQAFNNSKLLQRDAKDIAAKKWVRNLYENKEAMSRAAGRDLTADEIKAVRKELPNAVAEKIKLYNEGVDKYKSVEKGVKEIATLNESTQPTLFRLAKEELVGTKKLTKDEMKTLLKNIAELPEYDKSASFSHINVDRILKGIPKEKHNVVKDVLSDVIEVAKGLTAPVPTALATLKAADTVLNKTVPVNLRTNKELEIKPDYYARGSEPTPVSDFIASLFNVDFNDPARFNKKDIDTFFEFLEDAGYIEPGIKDKWTPRQKVSVMREILSDETINKRVKEKWAESEYKENLSKYYNNRYNNMGE